MGDQTFGISGPGEAAKYVMDRNKALAPGGNVTHVVNADPPKEPAAVVAAAEPEVEVVDPKKAAEPFIDPETLETIAEPTRNDKRRARLWQEREAEKQMRVAAEKRVAELEATLKAGNAAPEPRGEPTAAEKDALTTAAQARIRPKPDRAAIGSTYATYEDYVEDCAIWGGELAAEKRELIRDSQQTQTAQDHARSVFAQERAAAVADYSDFEQVTTQQIQLTYAMADAVINAPAGLKGHVQYWLGTHPEETARIAALPPQAALIEMGMVIATVKADRTAKASGTPEPKPKTKPQSDAPDPPDRSAPRAALTTPVHRVADPGSANVNVVDWMKGRNEEVAARRRL